MRPLSLHLSLFLLSSLLLLACSSTPDKVRDTGDSPGDTGSVEIPVVRRVPAEWEPVEAVWMQWPNPVEAGLREDFARILDVIPAWETVHLLVADEAGAAEAMSFLAARGVSTAKIRFESIPHDWSWMRDNGPVWVLEGERMLVQDWGFDAWGWEDRYARDDAVPAAVAEHVGLGVETYDLVVERGTLEFNGHDTLITSWPCLHDRNPDWSREDMEALFMEAFGVERVLWLESYASDDLTLGHVDGMARFVGKDRVVVPRYVDPSAADAGVYDESADILEAAGLDVVRMDVPGAFVHRGVSMSAVYVNWLVLDEVVVATGFGEPAWDLDARAFIEGVFPGREVLMVETRDLWYFGGGVHCVTNDQPGI